MNEALRSIKRNYSWLPKGRSCAIINDQLKGKATLILATLSNNKWFAMVIVGTVDSEIFLIFIKFLELIIKSEQEYPLKLPTIIIDNAKTHTSGLTKEVVSKIIYKIRFLPLIAQKLCRAGLRYDKIKTKIKWHSGDN